MTGSDNMPVPPPPGREDGASVPEQQGEGLQAELAKVRSRNKLLVGLTVVLGTIFVLLAVGGYIVYMKINSAREDLGQFLGSMQEQANTYHPESLMPAGQGGQSSTSMPASSLGLFSGGLPGGDSQGGSFDPEAAQRMVAVLQKYSDRPIVKEFMADLRKLPGADKALDPQGGNPMAMLAVMRDSKGLNNLAMKYSGRPEFLGLLMEIMKDPEMQPVLKMLPPGALSGMPGAPRPQASRPRQAVYPENTGEEGPVRFDPSIISGTAVKPPAPN